VGYEQNKFVLSAFLSNAEIKLNEGLKLKAVLKK